MVPLSNTSKVIQELSLPEIFITLWKTIYETRAYVKSWICTEISEIIKNRTSYF